MEELLLQEIALIIQTEVKDPRLTGFISVVRVVLSPDFKNAVVHVSVWSNKNIDADRKKDLEALQSSKKYIMFLLSKKLEIRYVPDLEFKLDISMEQASRVSSILKRNAP
jgi:ribosome-binding factor A